MTSDPMAPGAAAVYLNISEVDNDPKHFQSRYARIKVLSEKGKDLATVELPYLKGTWKVTDIKGRTIHPDGTVVPLTGKPADLLSEKSGGKQFGRKVFTLPSVEVGSILEYRYEIHYSDDTFSSPTWEIQRRYLVRKAHYEFKPFGPFMPGGGTDAFDSATNSYLVDEHGHRLDNLIWWKRLPPGVAIQTSPIVGFSVDVTDVPAIPDEEWMPPISTLLYEVGFYYIAANNAMNFWISEANSWAKDVDKFAVPSPEIKAAVSGLIAPADSDLDKARKLYAAVQALENTDYSRKKTASELKELGMKPAAQAEDTWKQKSGSSEEIAMLYLAMLRAAGLTAYPIKVVDRDQGRFDPSHMSLNQLDTTLVQLNSGGESILIDPGEKMCPFGTVNWRHSGTRGIGENPQGTAIATTPQQSYKDNKTTRSGSMTVGPQGEVNGTLSIEMTGQEALRWRQEALRVDAEELKKQFDDNLEKIVPEGVEAHVDQFQGLDNPDATLIATATVKGTLGTVTAKRTMLPGFFFETRSHQPFVNEEKRAVPVDMHYGDIVNSTVTYLLPDGVSVEGTPADADFSWPGHAFYFSTTRPASGQIVVTTSLAKSFAEVKPEAYQDLRGFYQQVAAADQGQVVLAIAAGGTGN